MPESKQSSSNLGASAIWVLLAAAGTYFVVHTPPLERTRPPTTEAFLREQPSLQDVEARLWQDPFAAVADKLAKSNDLKRENCEKKVEIRDDHCRSPLRKAQQTPLVMIASAVGSPYSEDHEYRRRLRYAILAGLSRQGFVPRDPEHLGFFWPRAVIHSKIRLPEIVPFEEFRGNNGQPALLFWFDEDVLDASPLQQFDEFCRILKTGLPDSIELERPRILGPETSTSLRAMAHEARNTWSSKYCSTWKSANPREKPKEVRAEFYVFSATAADSAIIPTDKYDKITDKGCHEAGDCLSQFFIEKNVNLYRMTTTDVELAGAMRDELSPRWPRRVFEGVKQTVLEQMNDRWPALSESLNKGLLNSLSKALGFIHEYYDHHVVLISEWDTLYGQSLPDAVASCLALDPSIHCTEIKEELLHKSFIHRFSYLRGLDGQTPNTGDPNSTGVAKGADKSEGAGDNQEQAIKDRAKTVPGAKPNDRAEGQGQFDYLERLGDEIRKLDDRLRSGLDEDPTQKSRKGIAAVGVLGSDNYDKLLILQALRPLLPNALFFTTDLEAQMLHPTARPYTRNLLVASSFGLRLKDELQGEIPPFRSNYQTAAFFATQAAVKGRDGRACTWMEPALLFEVGLSGLFQIPPATGDEAKNRAIKPELQGVPCAPPKSGIHPQGSDMYPQLSRGYPLAVAAPLVAIGLGITLICSFLRRNIWSFFNRLLNLPGRPVGLIALITVLFVALSSLLVGLAWAISGYWPSVAGWLTNNGQPIIWLNGLSTWPTTILRAVIFVACALLFARAFRWLNNDFDDVASGMAVTGLWKGLTANERKHGGKPWNKFVHYFYYPKQEKGPPGYEERFWGPYIYQGLWEARIWRTLAGVAVFFIIWGVLELMLGNPPAPTRGPTSFWSYTVISGLLNFMALFLTLFVADATLLCWRVVKALLDETDSETNEEASGKAPAGEPPSEGAPAAALVRQADVKLTGDKVSQPAAEKLSVWPEDTKKRFSERVGLAPIELEHWINLVFISKRTKCITTLIYFPFIIVALVIVSRSGLFANYAPSLPEILVMALGLLVVTGSAIALRQAAEESRRKAHRRLNDQIMRARQSQTGEHRATQLELLSHRVEELNEGALTPFTQQPLLRAMLLPLGSFGGTALAEYLLLPGFS